MADLIKIKAGSGNVPTLQERELAYRKDEKALYIGTDDKNERLCGAEDLSEVNSRLDGINAEIGKIKIGTNDLMAEINAARNDLMAEINAIQADINNINARLDALTPTE